MLKIFVLLALSALMPLVASASTIDLSYEFDFKVEKVGHGCFGTIPSVPDGECGAYQQLKLGTVYTGSVSISGEFSENPNGSLTYVGGTETCLFGTYSCFIRADIGNQSTFSLTSVKYRPFIGNFNSYFEWDLVSGTGFHTWEDDDLPFGVGEFEFTDVAFKISGGTTSAVPIPASGGFMIVCFALLGWLRARNV